MTSGLEEKLKKEKQIRVAYQTIVYEICTLVDIKLGHHSSGAQRFTTIDQLIPTLKKLLKS